MRGCINSITPQNSQRQVKNLAKNTARFSSCLTNLWTLGVIGSPSLPIKSNR